MEICNPPVGVAVGQKVALSHFVALALVLERLQPCLAGFRRVQTDHLGPIYESVRQLDGAGPSARYTGARFITLGQSGKVPVGSTEQANGIDGRNRSWINRWELEKHGGPAN